MTTEELQRYLQSEKRLTLRAVQNIIYELKNDCLNWCGGPGNMYKDGYCNGEANAFYICLDLLSKVEDKLDTAGLRRRFNVLADYVGVERDTDPREILDLAFKYLKGGNIDDRDERLHHRIDTEDN